LFVLQIGSRWTFDQAGPRRFPRLDDNRLPNMNSAPSGIQSERYGPRLILNPKMPAGVIGIDDNPYQTNSGVRRQLLQLPRRIVPGQKRPLHQHRAPDQGTKRSHQHGGYADARVATSLHLAMIREIAATSKYNF
jgi:hypothetical protein